MKAEAEMLYQEAYNLHYKIKAYNGAINGYLRTIKVYPDSNEAKYCKQQIKNLNKMPVSLMIYEDLQSTYETLIETKKEIEEKEEAAKKRYLEHRKTVESECMKKEEVIEGKISEENITTTDSFVEKN